MKQLFKNHIWIDEISLWKYIQTIDQAPTGTADGLYIIELNSDIGCVKYQQDFYFANQVEGRNFLYTRDYTFTRIIFRVTNGSMVRRTHEGYEIDAIDKLENGIWVNRNFFDRLADTPNEKTKFTQEECQQAVNAVLKLLVVQSKKVG